MKIHRVVLLIVDSDDLGATSTIENIENVRYPNRCLSPRVMKIETKEVEWSDDHPLNHSNTMHREFNRMFDIGWRDPC